MSANAHHSAAALYSRCNSLRLQSCAAVSATHSPCRLCCWLCLLSFTTRTCCPSWLCCSFSPLDVLPLPVTGWQTYALSATSGTTTWCNALRSLALTPSSAPASTKGSKAFYAWKLLIAHLLITVWRNCYVAHVGFFILVKQGTRILCTSCNASRSTIPSLPWLLSLQKPRRPLATACAAAGLLIASSSSSSSSIRISGQP